MIVFIDHKIKFCKVEGLHALNGINTLDCYAFAIFCKKSFFFFSFVLFKQFFSSFFCDLSYLGFSLVSNIISLKFSIFLYL